MRFAVFLRADLVLALPRFERFFRLRVPYDPSSSILTNGGSAPTIMNPFPVFLTSTKRGLPATNFLNFWATVSSLLAVGFVVSGGGLTSARGGVPASSELSGVLSVLIFDIKPSIGFPRRADIRATRFVAEVAASPCGNHLAQVWQVGEGVSPTLDAKPI